MNRIGQLIATLFGPLADRVADRIAGRLEAKLPDLSDLDDQIVAKLPDLSDLDDQIVAKLPDLSNLPKQVADAFTGLLSATPVGGIADGLPGLADNLTEAIRSMFTGRGKK